MPYALSAFNHLNVCMSDLLNALLLGIVEGLTEFLPISSTGHLLITERWLGARSDFFNIVIQAGAILAVMLVLRQRLWTLITGWNQPQHRDYVLKLGTAFVVTAAVGLPVRLMGWELPETLTPVAWALLLGGLWMILAEYLAERWHKTCPSTNLPDDFIPWKIAIAVGFAQVVAGVFPGTSRSAAAIFIALLLGLRQRAAAAEFVFLVGIPTMLAASAWAGLELLRHPQAVSENWGQTGLAFVAAIVTGFSVVKWLLDYVKKHRFTGFALYRIILGAGLLLWLPTGQ